MSLDQTNTEEKNTSSGSPTDLSDINLMDLDRFAESTPHDWFDRLRRDAPVFWNEDEEGGFWSLTKYEDVKFVSRSPELFSSQMGATNIKTPEPDQLSMIQRIMINMDPPEHRSFRAMVKHAFTPRMVKKLGGVVEEMARVIVDDVATKGQCEFVDEIAAQMPMQVICEMVGVADEDRRAIYDITNRLIGFDDPEMQEQHGSPDDNMAEMFMYASKTAAHIRENPGDNLATTLLNAEVEGERLDEMDFNMFFLMLAVAGNETTRTVTTHGARLLMEHPDQRAEIIANPALLDNAIREMLRNSPAVHHFRRTATQDLEIRGQAIKAGERVVIWYPAANHDEEIFTDPHRFDIHRDPNDHLSYGVGEHFCLGAHLAHLELRCILSEIITRLPDMDFAGPVRRLRSNFINGVKEMQVSFTPETKN